MKIVFERCAEKLGYYARTIEGTYLCLVSWDGETIEPVPSRMVFLTDKEKDYIKAEYKRQVNNA